MPFPMARENTTLTEYRRNHLCKTGKSDPLAVKRSPMWAWEESSEKIHKQTPIIALEKSRK